MKQHQGIWLPDGETHLTEWMSKAGELIDGKGTYQIKKLRKAVSYCKQFRTAIDVGAHCGMWSMQLAKRFQRVEAFEPVAAHRACFLRNVPNAEQDAMQHVWLHACALGDHEGHVDIHTEPTSSGDSYVQGEGPIALCTLDSFNITDVDFIKLDCEGYELFALRGGEETIKKYKPVVIVEQKPGKAQKFGLGEVDAVRYLQLLGYKQAEEISGDYIMVPA